MKGSMEELKGRKRGMLTTGVWCNPFSKMLHHVKKGSSGNWAQGLRMISTSFVLILRIVIVQTLDKTKYRDYKKLYKIVHKICMHEYYFRVQLYYINPGLG